ncbi:MAG: single-stranded DNA-binding protein [Planctomycetes bacterium]|nr:single-stranded DNA-binding protein [Planctomycetota bacterium]
MTLERITEKLVRAANTLCFAAPTAYVYNPLDYARATHDAYVSRYAKPTCEVLLLGMNPGPWGMVQTGVPFGEVNAVREWLKIDGPIGRPKKEHPKRPVQGLACPRSEVSGARLWGWARATFGTPARFFKRFFVANYCPLAFLENSGRNRTPDKLPAVEREPLFAACDEALRGLIDHLKPRRVIGVGAFAESRLRAALTTEDPRIGRILHPSPASPAANRDWSATVTRQFAELGVALPS